MSDSKRIRTKLWIGASRYKTYPEIIWDHYDGDPEQPNTVSIELEHDADGSDPKLVCPECDKQKDRADKFMWQVRDTCKRAEKAEARIESLEKALTLLEHCNAKLKAQLEDMKTTKDALAVLKALAEKAEANALEEARQLKANIRALLRMLSDGKSKNATSDREMTGNIGDLPSPPCMVFNAKPEQPPIECPTCGQLGGATGKPYFPPEPGCMADVKFRAEVYLACGGHNGPFKVFEPYYHDGPKFVIRKGHIDQIGEWFYPDGTGAGHPNHRVWWHSEKEYAEACKVPV